MLKGDLMDSVNAYRSLVHLLLANAGGSVVISQPDLKRALRTGTRIDVEKVGDSETRVFRLVNSEGKQVRV